MPIYGYASASGACRPKSVLRVYFSPCATPAMSLRERAWHHPVPETAQDSLDYYMGWPSWLSASVVTVVCAYWHHVMTVFPYVRFSAQLGLKFAMPPNLHAPWVMLGETKLWVAPCRRNKTSTTWHGGKCGAQKNCVSKRADTHSNGNKLPRSPVLHMRHVT